MKKLNNLIVHCALSIVHQSKTLTLLLVMLMSVNMMAAGTWTRVTTIKELTDGGTFIMGYEATAKSGVIIPLRSADCNATTTANGYFNTGKTANSSTNSTIDMSKVTETADYEVYITSPSSGKINIQMKDKDGNFYGATSGGSTKNSGRLYTSGNSAETNLTPAFTSAENNQFKLTGDVTGQYKYLKYNTGSPRFAYYNSAGSNIVFYKKAAATDPCTVTFDAGSNGTLSCPSCTEGNKLTEASAGDGVTLPSVTANDGWKFLGWATTSGATTVDAGEAGATYKPSKDITLYAVYVEVYTISWSANGTSLDPTYVEKGQTLVLPEDPDPATYCNGKAFVGWTATSSVAPDGTGITYVKAGDKVGATTAYYAVFADEGELVEKTLKWTISAENIAKTDLSAASGYDQYAGDQTIDGIVINLSNVMLLDEKIQFKKSSSSGILYNKTSFGKITKIEITGAGLGVYESSSMITSKPSSGAKSASGTSPYTYNCSGNNGFFYLINTASTAATPTEISVSYKTMVPSYSNYTTTCAPTYEATVADGITNGSVLISKTDDATAGAASLTGLKQGDKVYIFPTANTGYNIESVIVNETPISAQSGKYSYTIGEAGITVSATFAAKQTINITANKPDGGTYTVQVDDQTPITVTKAETIPAYEGAVITMTSTADETHKLHSTPFVVKDADNGDVKVSKDGDNYSFTMSDKAVTVTAQYTATYSITAADCTGGSITKITDKDGKDIIRTSSGSKVIVKLSANEHYHIKSVYFIKEGEEGHNEITENAGVYSFNMVASNVTVYAEFEEDTKYTITFVDKLQHTASIPNTTNNEIVVYENEIFTFPMIGDKTAATSGTCEQIHYHFMGWSTSEGSVSAGDIKTGTSAAVTAAATYYAVWAKEEL